MAGIERIKRLGREQPFLAALLALAVVAAGWTTVFVVAAPEPAAHEYVSWGPPEGGLFVGLKLLRYSIQYGIYIVVAGLLAKFFGLFGGSGNVPPPTGRPKVDVAAFMRPERGVVRKPTTQETDVNEIVAAIGRLAEIIKQDRKDNEVRFAALEDAIKGAVAAVEKGNASELAAANDSLKSILDDLAARKD